MFDHVYRSSRSWKDACTEFLSELSKVAGFQNKRKCGLDCITRRVLLLVSVTVGGRGKHRDAAAPLECKAFMSYSPVSEAGYSAEGGFDGNSGGVFTLLPTINPHSICYEYVRDVYIHPLTCLVTSSFLLKHVTECGQ